MTDPITPKANRRIIDGEVVNEAIGKQARKAASAKTFREDAQQDKQQADKSSSLTQRVSQLLATTKKYAMMFVILLFVIILWIALSQQNNQDWQIQKINELQSQVGQLSSETESLKTEQARLETLLAKQATQQSEQAAFLSKPVLGETDIQAIKTQLNQLKTRLSELGSDYGNQLKTLSSELSKALENADSKAMAQGLGNQVEEKLTEMGSQISDLFSFQNELLAQKPVLQDPAVLSAMKMQQWVLDINGQWILMGDVAQTKQQLLALEQALGLSESPQKMALMRAIGEDLNRIENLENQPLSDNQHHTTEALKSWLLALKTVPAKSAAKPETSALSANQPESAEVSEADVSVAPPPSSLDRLKGALTGLFSIQKRSDPAALNSVEKGLLSEVMKQRALLLVDKMNWAMTLKSETQLQLATAEFKDFMRTQFAMSAAQSQQMNSLLAPFAKMDWATRTPLKIMGAL